MAVVIGTTLCPGYSQWYQYIHHYVGRSLLVCHLLLRYGLHRSAPLTWSAPWPLGHPLQHLPLSSPGWQVTWNLLHSCLFSPFRAATYWQPLEPTSNQPTHTNLATFMASKPLSFGWLWTIFLYYFCLDTSLLFQFSEQLNLWSSFLFLCFRFTNPGTPPFGIQSRQQTKLISKHGKLSRDLCIVSSFNYCLPPGTFFWNLRSNFVQRLELWYHINSHTFWQIKCRFYKIIVWALIRKHKNKPCFICRC